MNKGHNFRYVQFQTPTGTGYACVSFDWDKTDDNIKYAAGIVFCNPNERRFNKERARAQASVRREGQREKSRGLSIRANVPSVDKTRFVSNAEFENVLRDIIYRATKMSIVPHWAIRALRDENVKFGMHQEQRPKHKLSQVMSSQLRFSVCMVPTKASTKTGS